jgi:hypothetical protein
MKTLAFALTTLALAVLGPSGAAAADALRLLAQVAHAQAEDASKDLEELAEKQKDNIKQKQKIRALQKQLEQYKQSVARETDAVAKLAPDASAAVKKRREARLDSLRKQIAAFHQKVRQEAAAAAAPAGKPAPSASPSTKSTKSR